MEEKENMPSAERLGQVVDELVERNKEGFEKLAEEELAQERREESLVSRAKREIKRKLGLRRSGARTIAI